MVLFGIDLSAKSPEEKTTKKSQCEAIFQSRLNMVDPQKGITEDSWIVSNSALFFFLKVEAPYPHTVVVV